ncbi:MAG TPA: Ku protein, partial [Flavobacteriaceae bacterium]|nr:Ku protein [Flavobacteriaceae bacterium]
MRAIWSGAISFGLVNIPIKLYSATSKAKLDLDMLDPSDLSHIRYKRVNEETGKEVPWDKIVKGYKYEDEYIVLDEEDFERASPEKTERIDIQEFTDAKSVDAMFFEKPYYVEPGKGGKKPYQLLVEALEKTDKVGIATFVLRKSESLALLRSKNGMLILQKLRFAEEIRNPEDLKLPEDTKVKKEELKMAKALIDQYSVDFDASKYKE